MQVQSDAPLPATYVDPAVPLLQLPTNFRARRTTANLTLTPGMPVEIIHATGAGCARQLRFVFARIPIALNTGAHQILIKTNHRQDRERHLWAIHCAVE